MSVRDASQDHIHRAVDSIASSDDHRAIWREFVNEVCGGCGKRKKSGQSFCGRCWHALPEQLRQRLWQRFGQGYEEAHAEAKRMLKGGRAA